MVKNALILDGGTGDGENTRRAGELASDILQRSGWEVASLALREMTIAPCLGCFGCWIKTPGECVIDDAGRDVAAQIVRSDLLVYLTPLTFGGYSSQLKKALDRMIPNILPFFRFVNREIHHVKRYARYPRLAAIGTCPDEKSDPDEEDLFEMLVHRNAINMHAPKYATCVVDASDDDDVRQRRIENLLGRVGV